MSSLTLSGTSGALPLSDTLRSPTLVPSAMGILQMVERKLRESSYYYLRSISCAYDSGVLTVRGRVPTFYLKQTVQSIVEKVEGVQQVVNLVDVINPATGR